MHLSDANAKTRISDASANEQISDWSMRCDGSCLISECDANAKMDSHYQPWFTLQLLHKKLAKATSAVHAVYAKTIILNEYLGDWRRRKTISGGNKMCFTFLVKNRIILSHTKYTKMLPILEELFKLCIYSPCIYKHVCSWVLKLSIVMGLAIKIESY